MKFYESRKHLQCSTFLTRFSAGVLSNVHTSACGVYVTAAGGTRTVSTGNISIVRRRETELYERDSAKHATTTTQAKQQYVLLSLKNTSPPSSTPYTTISASSPFHSTLIFTTQIIILVSLVLYIPSLLFPSLYLPLFRFFATPLVSSPCSLSLSHFPPMFTYCTLCSLKMKLETFGCDVISG